MRGPGLVLAMCVGEVASLMPLATFPALVPQFSLAWGLSNTEAGWISGIYYLGYMLFVPVLVSLTDRIDARSIFLVSAGVSALATLGFAIAADGPWSALFWRLVAGAGLAGTYMPGLKALTDRGPLANQSRGIALYTASYSVGAGLSFLLAGIAVDLYGWRGAFYASALGPFLALLIAGTVLRPIAPVQVSAGPLLDFRPVLRNRAALGYILAYGGHGFELMAMRAWIVVFVEFLIGRASHGDPGPWSSTLVATLVTLIGLPASLLGNEFAIRFGRRGVIVAVMSASALVACVIGFAASLPFGLVIGLILLYAVTVTADSGALTAGAVAAAAPEQRGATMAVHSTVGFGASFLGPLLVGVALDLFGGNASLSGWAAAFVTMALGAAFGPLALLACRPSERR